MIETSRPTFRQIYMDLAFAVSKRSTCHRLQVGCVITSPDYRKVIALGYNGNATGLPNGCDSAEPGKCGCIHAEQNAVINCDEPRYTKKVVFTTHLPCTHCAKFLINLGGVERVFYRIDYRIKDSIDLMQRAGIPMERLMHPILADNTGTLPP